MAHDTPDGTFEPNFSTLDGSSEAILAILQRHDGKSTRVLLICGTTDRASTQAVLLCDIHLQHKVGFCEYADL